MEILRYPDNDGAIMQLLFFFKMKLFLYKALELLYDWLSREKKEHRFTINTTYCKNNLYTHCSKGLENYLSKILRDRAMYHLLN